MLEKKLKYVVETISSSKNCLNLTAEDFRSYEFIYNKEEKKWRPVLIFGNVKIDDIELERIENIVKKYPQGVECVILMISEGVHQ